METHLWERNIPGVLVASLETGRIERSSGVVVKLRRRTRKVRFDGEVE